MWSFFSRDPAKGFPYEVGEKVAGLESDNSIWSLHEGKQKVSSELIFIFHFNNLFILVSFCLVSSRKCNAFQFQN